MTDPALAIIFQQEMDPDMKQPWPVVIDGDHRVVHGRPDCVSLVGFQQGTVQDVVLTAAEALREPERAIGLVPVLSGTDGRFWAVGFRVVSCRFYEAGEAALTGLREHEAQMRNALQRAGV